MKLSVERLENRENPGGDLLALPIWMGIVSAAPPRWNAIPTPKADLILISPNVDGKTSHYLDNAHDVLNVGPSADVTSVRTMTEKIDAAFKDKKERISLVVVAKETGDQSRGFVIGHDYVFRNSDPYRSLAAEQGEIKSITFLISNAKPKADLYQDLATALGDNKNSVTITSYAGELSVITTKTPEPYFVVSGSTTPMTWTSKPQDTPRR